MELLAPAGGYAALVAAVEAGADAVYTGGMRFSARQNADNLSLDEMKRAVEYCHLRDRRLYVAVNTLIADQELEEALDFVFSIKEIGVDGIIIQDLGLLRCLRSLFPDLRLHASTQMTIHNGEGARFAYNEGMKRVVLARELSREEVAIIHRQYPEIELEFFVHGAICYSFSGQCLFSSMVGGRSGNRGNCAQPCRLTYRLYEEGKMVSDPARPHLLSPADLCLLPYLKEMEEAGVVSLKIEGRMKRPEYVATVTHVYRQALDLGRDLTSEEIQEFTRTLLAAFNRNFTTGYWHGPDRGWLSPTRPNNRGTFLGRVTGVQGARVKISLKDDLRCGDGLEVWTRAGNNAVTVVRRILAGDREVEYAPAGNEVEIELSGVNTGDRVFKTSDVDLIERAEELSRENRPEGRRPVKISVYARIGEPLKITIKDIKTGYEVTSFSRETLPEARRKPTTAEEIKEKIGELGDAPFLLTDVIIDLDGKCLVPFSWIKELRREAVGRLKRGLLAMFGSAKTDVKLFSQGKEKLLGLYPLVYQTVRERKKVLLTVATNSYERALAALKAGADRVYLNIAGERGQRVTGEDVLRLREVKKERQLLIAGLPRIYLPGERIGIDPDLWDGVLVANPGWLRCAFLGEAIADHSLNAFNCHAVGFLLERGMNRVCLSLELNMDQIKYIASRFPGRVECVVHGDIPLMVSRFCPLGYNVGSVSCRECYAPCLRSDYHLVDRKGYRFPVKTDRYGRFYLYNSRTLCGLEEVGELMRAGVGAVRLELALESAASVEKIVSIYRSVMDDGGWIDQKELGELRDELRKEAVSDFSKLHFYRGVVASNVGGKS